MHRKPVKGEFEEEGDGQHWGGLLFLPTFMPSLGMGL